MQAIVLSRRDFREYDQVVSLYTREKGKLELLARGVKKMVSKNAAHLEPFMHVLADAVPGKEIDHLTTSQTIASFPGIRADVQKIRAAWYAATAVDRLVHVRERDEKLYKIFLDWLRFVEQINIYRPILLDGFMVALMSCLGFSPELSHCVICRKEFRLIADEAFAKKGKSGLYFAGGGIICSGCRIGKESAGEIIYDCTLTEVSNMQLLQKANWRLISEYPIDEKENKRLHRLVYEFVTYHTERQLADWGN